MKKILSIALAIVMICSILTACENQQNNANNQSTAAAAATTGAATAPATTAADAADTLSSDYGDTGGLKLPIVTKPENITWMIASDLQGVNDKPIVKELEKRTGIDLDLQCVAMSSYVDKLQIVLASGKLPDVCYGVTDAQQYTLGEQGALACISDYIEILPNFKKLYADNPENSWALKSFANVEGKMYQYPIYNMARDVNFGWLYRADIFEKNGINPWTDSESFYQAVKKLKQIYPNSYPVLSKWKDNTFTKFSYSWGLFSENNCVYYNYDAKKWQLIYSDPQYKAMLDFMKKLYNEGLLDPEFLTCTMPSYQAKITADDNGAVAFDWIGWMQSYHDQVKDKNANFNLKYGVPIGSTGKIMHNRKVAPMGIVVAKNDRTETTLKLMDYLISPSGSELMTLGIEGVEYNMVNGKPVYPELKDISIVSPADLETRYGAFLESLTLKVDPRSAYFNFTPNEQEAQDIMLSQKRIEEDPPLPVFTNEETEVRAEYESVLIQKAKEFSAKYVMDKNYGDAQWTEWVDTANKSLGGKAEVYVFNTAQKRLDAGK